MPFDRNIQMVKINQFASTINQKCNLTHVIYNLVTEVFVIILGISK